jgi:PAS domain S-box-containing protein
MNRLFLRCLIAFAVQVCGLCQQPASGQKKNILILNSYHQGYQWTDDQTRGVIEVMGRQKANLKFYIADMDTKWAFSQDYFRLLNETYKLKFKNIQFDVIVATDDDAFDFLRQYRDGTFGQVPVVFCGVNWFKPEALRGQTLYTGVNEDADIAANLDLMLEFHPDVRHIYFIVDNTTTGRIVHQKILELVPKYRDRVAIHLLDDLEMPELLATISKLTRDSLVFLTIYQQDRSGAFFEYSEITELLSRNSAVPVYGLWDYCLGHGILGGKLTSGLAQGTSAGELALRILAGEAPAAIPVVMESPNKYLFDYAQLKRFGMLDVRLPPTSRVINRPLPIYALNRNLFWGLVTGLFTLTAGLIGLLFYIRVRRKAEVSLRKSEERYHSLVDNLTLGIYRVSADDGRFLQVNPAMPRMFGFDSTEEMLATSLASLHQEPGEQGRFSQENLIDDLGTDREFPMLRKDGQPVWVSVHARAHRDEAGRVLWLDGVLEDITERKALETQLRQSQKMEAVGTLAGGIAHDFNNLLTVILGYGNMLKKNFAHESTGLEQLGRLLSASEKAAQLTRGLLAFSRKQVISPKPADLNDIVEGMGRLLYRLIDADIVLSFDLHAHPLPVLADAGQIEQVLLNLATNARDSMPNGGPIRVSTRRVRLDEDRRTKDEVIASGDYAVLSVTDTGCGMDESLKQRIFEPFFTTKAVGKGTGLGLSTSYGIVRQHHGDISIQSEPGLGTTFKVYLPIIQHEGRKLEHAAQAPAEGGTETILLAEDNEEVRNLTRDILVSGGYRVLVAGDGPTAVSMFKALMDEIDFVLLDVVMPGMSGREVYDAVKSLRPQVKALFMSGYTADMISQKGILEAGIHYLAKPVAPDALLRKVREILHSA